jgi:hypothetical protein
VNPSRELQKNPYKHLLMEREKKGKDMEGLRETLSSG